MSTRTSSAEEGFNGGEGRFASAFNSAMHAKTLDGATLTNLIAGLQRQAQGLAQLAAAIGEMDDKLNALKHKLGVP